MSKDRGAFEQGWKEAFEGKQMSPPEGIWDKIDSELSKDESRKYKKRIFFYKLMAAASIVFALSVGIISLYDFTGRENTASDVAGNVDPGSILESDQLSNERSADNSENNSEANEALNQTDVKDEPIAEKSESGQGEAATLIADASEESNEKDNKDSGIEDSQSTSNTEAGNTPIAMVESESDENAINGEEFVKEYTSISYADNIGVQTDQIRGNGFTSVEGIPMGYEIINKKDKQENVFLAGVNFSTGVFNPNFSAAGGSASPALSDVNGLGAETSFNGSEFRYALFDNTSGNSTERELPDPSVMYSYGLNLGYKLNKRFILFTGFNYTLAQAKEQSSYVATDENRNTYPVSTFSGLQEEKNINNIKKVEGTDLTNRYEFASIPVKVGYMLFDQKFNVTLYTGLSPELMVGNSIDVETDQPLDVQEIDNVSGFNDFHLNGMAGIYLGYLIGEHYQLSIEPSYKKSLTSLIQDDNYFEGYPSYFLVSFGLAYQFK